MGRAERCGVRVVARFRPLSKDEIARGDADKQPFGVSNMAVVDKGAYNGRQYVMDKIIEQGSEQEEVYQIAANETVEEVLKGYNGTLFAYGQTGAGKSYTMFGADKEEKRGIIPRAVEHLFKFGDEKAAAFAAAPIEGGVACVEFHCSFFQIYNEQVLDLLCADAVGLNVRQSVDRGVYVEGLRELQCKTAAEVIELIRYGETNRVVSATAMNAESSRSHSVFCIQCHQKSRDGFMKVTGAGMQEALAINSSLTALGKVIKALTETGRSHIPFRESKLTYILQVPNQRSNEPPELLLRSQDSLAGNSKTTLIVALSPHVSNHEETVATLQFAERCKMLKNKVVKSKIRSVAELAALVEALTRELDDLKKYNKLLEGTLQAAGLPLPEASARAEAGGDSDDESAEELSRLAAAKKTAQDGVDVAQGALASAEASGDEGAATAAREALKQAEAKQQRAEQEAADAISSGSGGGVELAEMRVRFDTLKQQHALQTDELATVLSMTQTSKGQFEQSTAEMGHQIEQLQATVAALQEGKDSLEAEAGAVQHKLAQAESDLTQTMNGLCTKSGRVKTLEKEAAAMRLQLTELETSVEQSQGGVEASENAKAEATESLAQVNSVCREQAARLAGLEAEVAEKEVSSKQSSSALLLERGRVEQLQEQVTDEAKNTAGYKQAFEAMVENEQVGEAELINKTRQIHVLQQEIALLEIKARWGDQRRSLQVMAQVGDCALTGDCVEHFEAEQWHKSRMGRRFGRSRFKPEMDQSWRDQAAPEGQEWQGEWQIDGAHTAVDQDGWSYGRSEQELTDRRQGNVSQQEKGPEDEFRTRRWVRAVE